MVEAISAVGVRFVFSPNTADGSVAISNWQTRIRRQIFPALITHEQYLNT